MVQTSGKWRQAAAFVAGTAAATLLADVVLLALSRHAQPALGLVHHLEFLATLIALVGLGGVMALQMPHGRELGVRALVALGALAAVLGYGIGLALEPAVGATASIVAIVVAAAAVPLVAARWPQERR